MQADASGVQGCVCGVWIVSVVESLVGGVLLRKDGGLCGCAGVCMGSSAVM